MPLWKPPVNTVVSGVSPLTTTTSDNNGLSPGITYASPLLPFYGSGGLIPSVLNVSTLNAQDSITVGGVGQTLTGASGELLLNGKPLATISTVSTLITQGTSNWAKYPAVSTLQMNGNKMLNVSSISGVAGQTLPILAQTVSFGTLGELTGISSINGSVYPPPGNSADWATYPATVDVNMNSKNLNSANQVNMNTGGNAVMLTAGAGNTLYINGAPIPYPPPPAPTTPSTITGQNTYMLATGGTLASANSIITAGGGTGGNITATANAGDLGVSGGNISLTANGGTGVGGLYGVVNLTANAGTDFASGVNTGGAINILANSPTVGLTSKVSITGGGLNLYSGVFTPIASVFGYTFINASLGISLVAGSFTSAFQSPGTVYLYGAQGIVLDNGVYATDIQPIWDGNPLVPPAPLTIHGRTAGGSNVPVILNNVESIQMQGTGSISGVQTINGSACPPPAPSIPPNISVSTITFNPTNGDITNLNSINTGLFFTNTGDKMNFIPVLGNFVGQIEGISTLNVGLGISPLGDKITFPQSAGTNIGEIVNLSTINGVAYPPSGGAGTSITNAGATVECDSGGNISLTTANTATESITITSQGDTVISTTSGANSITLNNSGVVDIISGSGKSSYIALNSTTFNETGDILTFAQVGGLDVGQLVGISTINGSAYPPTATAGVSDLNGETGAVVLVAGTNITITPDTAGNITIDASAVLAGVSDLNGLSGSLNITSPDGSLNVVPTGTDVELSVVKNISVVVNTPAGTPEVIVPASGAFYAIDANATSSTVSFDVSGLTAGTTFTVKNISSSNDTLDIEFDDGTGSVPATGVNLPLLHPTTSFNSVICVCIWDGTSLKVY